MTNNNNKSKLPNSVSLADFAKLVGVSRSRVNELERMGIIKKLRHGVYPISAVADYAEYLRQTIQGSGAGVGLTAERAELVREKILIARLERKKLERELVPASQIGPAWEALASNIRTQMLAIPSVAGSRFGMIRNAVQLTAMLRREVEERLRAAATAPILVGDRELDDAPDPDPDDE